MSWMSDLRAYLARVFGVDTPTSKKATTPAASQNFECRFPLSDDSSDKLTLPDGRELGYAQYGSLTGKSIFYLHGLPGSRIEAARLHGLGQELGARIIATDRPGYGWSSPHPGRTLLGFPKDLDRLAAHLGINSYSVLGVSGGGPYVLACAMALPREKLKCASIVCGIGPPDIGMKGANWVNWVGFTFGWRYASAGMIRWIFGGEPGARLDLSDEKRYELQMQAASKISNKKDQEFFNDEDFVRLFLRGAREAYGQGFEAMTQDGKLMCLDWGFRIEDIRPDLPVQLWYGKQDTHVPLNHGVQIAARLGARAQLNVRDETHASLWVNTMKEAMEGIVKAA